MRSRSWFARIVLVGAALLLTRVGMGLVIDPAHGVAAQGIVLPSAEALSSMRAVGGGFLAIAVLLLVSLRSQGAMVTGLGILVTFVSGLTAARLLGLALDGPAPFTLRVLKPELALVILSGAALLLLSRGRAAPGKAEHRSPVPAGEGKQA